MWGEDPTVLALQHEVAARFERDDALFVPSGCQGNQIAARLHALPGEEVAVGEDSHCYDWELAGLAALSGLQARTLPSRRGCIDVEAARATLRPAGGFRPACRLLMVENTHNFHGGAVVPLAHLERLREVAREKGARVHLDGARLWNAAVASRTSLADYGQIADSVMVCLSKGLGAPVGSMLVGDRDWIARAREVRKLFGGGMRQVGVLAAPGLLAVRDGFARLHEDHARAARLAEGLVAEPGVTLPHGAVETNIVIVDLGDRDATLLVDGLAARGVLVAPAGPHAVRFVTHVDVGDEDVAWAIAAFAGVLSAGS